ncbi:MAG: integral rane protein [Pseudonocardia sp.]|nr:integral rane protein [Pseudonocardia sp.]
MPWWGALSAAAAPVLLIGGWTVAAARQPDVFDSTVDTISALAALDATDRAVMTTALVGLGACHVVTALALRPAATPGRFVLAAGGVATVLVAAFPLPADGISRVHGLAAGAAFLALAGWPAFAGRTGAGVPWTLRRRVTVIAAGLLLALLAAFVVAQASNTRVGLFERVAAGSQALWPLAVVLSARRAAISS